MHTQANSLHNLADAAINDLQSAFKECNSFPADGLILSALVKSKNIQDLLPGIKSASSDSKLDGYCRAA